MEFTDNEKIDGFPNEDLPLVFITGIHDHDLAKCLVDEGSSVTILYQDSFEKLGLRKEDLESYDDTELHGFNETRTHPLGYVKLGVTFGKGMDERTVEASFLVILVVSVYNYILGRLTQAALNAVTSTVRLKMKYHNKRGDVVTIHTDLNIAKRCHKEWEKLPALQSTTILKRTEELTGIPWHLTPNYNNVELDVRQKEKHPRGEKGQEMPVPLEANLPFERPTPDGEFKSVQLNDNPTGKVKIGSNLEENLIECLLANADIFACSP